jgi:hypothetical protein
VRFIRLSVLTHNSIVCTKLIELLGDILSSFVIPGHLDVAIKLVFHQCLVLLEGIESLSFTPQESNNQVSGLVINEGLPIAIPLPASYRKRALHIRVNKSKKPGLPGCGSLGNVMTMLLPKDARLTDWVRGTLRVDSHP